MVVVNSIYGEGIIERVTGTTVFRKDFCCIRRFRLKWLVPVSLTLGKIFRVNPCVTIGFITSAHNMPSQNVRNRRVAPFDEIETAELELA